MTEEKMELLKITSKGDASAQDEATHNNVFVKRIPVNPTTQSMDNALQKNNIVKDAWEEDPPAVLCSRQQLALDNNSVSQHSVSKSETERVRAKLRKLIVWRTVQQFLSSTSFHGFPVIANTRSLYCSLTCWIIPFLLALGIMLWALISVTKQYSEMNTILSSKVEFHNQLTFPAITICNNNYFRKSVAASTGIGLNKLVRFLNVVSGDPFLVADFDFEGFLNNHKDLIEEENSIFYFNNSGQQIDQMVYSCKFAGQDCLDNFVQRSSSYGSCYTFNSGINDTVLYSYKRGYRYGFEVILNAEGYEYFLAESDAVGFYVFIHDQEHFPYYDGYDGFSIAAGRQTQVAIRRVDFNLLTSSGGGQCSDDVNLKYFKSYSHLPCIAECLTDIVVNTCGCKGQYMPGPAEVCKLTNDCLFTTTNSFDEKQCNCPVPCKFTTYEKVLSYSKFPANHFAELLKNNDFLSQSSHYDFPDFIISTTTDENGAEVRYLNENFTQSFLDDNMVKLQIFYDTLIITTMNEGLEYSTFQFIADFGGHIGLFTGAGFLTLFEIIHLCCGLIRPGNDNV